MRYATQPIVNTSTCVRHVMKLVTFGIMLMRATLLEWRFCLTMLGQCCLLLSWLYGVSTASQYRYCLMSVLVIAVLYLEFWKRRQFQLQYEWDTLGYEAAEVCASTLILCYAFYYSSITLCRKESVLNLCKPSRRRSRASLNQRRSATRFSIGSWNATNTSNHLISCGQR